MAPRPINDTLYSNHPLWGGRAAALEVKTKRGVDSQEAGTALWPHADLRGGEQDVKVQHFISTLAQGFRHGNAAQQTMGTKSDKA